MEPFFWSEHQESSIIIMFAGKLNYLAKGDECSSEHSQVNVLVEPADVQYPLVSFGPAINRFAHSPVRKNMRATKPRTKALRMQRTHIVKKPARLFLFLFVFLFLEVLYFHTSLFILDESLKRSLK